MQERQPFDEYMLCITRTVASRSTCMHRKQGAVLTINKRIISTGFNGSPPGQPHCIDLGYCSKEKGLSCRAKGLHGESNAIASAAKMGVSVDGATIYCVYSPCEACCNLLKSAGIAEVKYVERYSGYLEGPEYLEVLGIKVTQIKEG